MKISSKNFRAGEGNDVDLDAIPSIIKRAIPGAPWVS
jgi:hypothetical protein